MVTHQQGNDGSGTPSSTSPAPSPCDCGERASTGRVPYPALNSALDGLLPAGLQHYVGRQHVSRSSPTAPSPPTSSTAPVPSMEFTMHLCPIDGAVHDVAVDAIAFAYRGANFAPVIAGMWPDPADHEATTTWVRDYHAARDSHTSDG